MCPVESKLYSDFDVHSIHLKKKNTKNNSVMDRISYSFFLFFEL